MIYPKADVVILDSTSLAWLRYSPARNLLEICFSGAETYRFFEVPASRYRELLAAPSKGGYFNRNIRNRFRHKRLPELGGIK